MSNKPELKRGATLLTVIVFGSVFVVLITALVSTVVLHRKVVEINEIKREALAISEAGLNYYRWYLAHNPNDFTNGTGNPGPYTIPLTDANGDRIGEYDIDILAEEECGLVSSVKLTSTGRSDRDPSVEHEITANYAKPPVSNYTFIVNDNAWIPAGTSIQGRYHANGGVHMQGSTDSTVSSAQTVWNCTESTGCDPANNSAAGVFGSGSNGNLWQYPVPTMDFAGLTVDLNELKARALSGAHPDEKPTYYEPTGASKKGYYLEFLDNNDREVRIDEVQSTRSYWSYNSADGWVNRREAISNGSGGVTFSLPDSCSVVFFEDDIWISGTVSNKLTIVAADLIDPNKDANVYIVGDIGYTAEGSYVDGVTILAQGSIYIPLEVPETLNLRGVFIAQNGSFTRNYYYDKDETPLFGAKNKHKVPGGVENDVILTQLNITGTVVSNGTPNFRWNDGSNNVSGFEYSNFTYDRQQAVNPPPLTPSISENFKFIDWRDEG